MRGQTDAYLGHVQAHVDIQQLNSGVQDIGTPREWHQEKPPARIYRKLPDPKGKLWSLAVTQGKWW